MIGESSYTADEQYKDTVKEDIMKNIFTIAEGFGIEIPEDKKKEFEKELLGNYKSIVEFEKQVSLVQKIEEEKAGVESRLKDAQATLDGFKDVDLEQINKDLEDYKQRAEDAKVEYDNKLKAREYEDLLTESLKDIKFTSEFAKKAVINELKEANLNMHEGKLVGFNDVIGQIKEKDASAFVNEEQQKLAEESPKFSEPIESSPDVKIDAFEAAFKKGAGIS